MYFFCAAFLRFIALNDICANCLGVKLRYHRILYPLNMLNKTKLTQHSSKKGLFSEVRVEEQVKV